MKLSMRSDYGVRAVIDLARRFGDGPVQSAEIAARESIPEAYLEQLLTSLRKAGLVRSSRGPRGGHELAREPALWRWARSSPRLKGRCSRWTAWASPTATGPRPARSRASSGRRSPSAANRILDTTTVAELVERQRSREQRVMYYI